MGAYSTLQTPSWIYWEGESRERVGEGKGGAIAPTMISKSQRLCPGVRAINGITNVIVNFIETF